MLFIQTFRFLLVAALLGSTAAARQTSVVFATAEGLEVHLVGVGLDTVHPTLTGLELLSLAPAGQLQLEELQPDRPRARRHASGAVRLALPQQHGSLYHFRRTAPGGAIDFGFFLVSDSGGAVELLALPGAGPSADLDPFLTTVAVARDGARGLVATQLAAGGDLYALDFELGSAELVTGALAPQAFQPEGLALLDGFALASTTTSVLRWSDGDPSAVAFPDSPTWYQGDVALSHSATRAVTIAGAIVGQGVPYVIGPTGPAVRGADSTGDTLGAGFLSSQVAGPTLAVSDDGHACAWTVEDGTKEVWLSSDVMPAPAQVTMDENYVDTLDQAGVLFFSLLGSLVMVVGESGGDEDVLESMDVFTIESTPAGEVITNVSLTSGEAATPFPKGELDPEDGIFRMPGADVLLTHDSRSSGEGSVLAIDPQSPGTTLLLDDAKQMDWVEASGSTAIYTVRRDLAGTRELHAWAVGSAPTTLFVLPEAVALDVLARSAGGWIAVRATLLGQEWLARLHVASGQAQLLASAPLRFGDDAWFGPDESLHFTVPFGAQAFLVEWNLAGGASLTAPAPIVGGILPGLEGF